MIQIKSVVKVGTGVWDVTATLSLAGSGSPRSRRVSLTRRYDSNTQTRAQFRSDFKDAFVTAKATLLAQRQAAADEAQEERAAKALLKTAFEGMASELGLGE